MSKTSRPKHWPRASHDPRNRDRRGYSLVRADDLVVGQVLGVTYRPRNHSLIATNIDNALVAYYVAISEFVEAHALWCPVIETEQGEWLKCTVVLNDGRRQPFELVVTWGGDT